MRGVYKLPFIDKIFFKKFLKKKNFFKTYIRYTHIPFNFIDYKIKVYNGKQFKDIKMRSKLVGFKIGMFSFTKKESFKIHLKDKDKKKKKKKK